jgi:hypothetical protein
MANPGGHEEFVPLGSGATPSAPSASADQDLPPLRPRGIGEILDLAFEILRRRPLACFGVSFALWLPARLLRTWYNTEFGLAPPDDVLGILAFSGVGMLMPILIPLIVAAALAHVTYATIQGQGARRATTFAVLRPVLFLRLMLVIFLVFVLTGIGTLACILPGVYLAWRLSTATTALVIEGLAPMESVKRSFALTRGTFLRWLGLFFVQQCLLLPFSGPVAVLDDPMLRSEVLSQVALSPPALEVLSLCLSTFFLSLASAFAGLVMAVYYLDCRVRADGFDLDMALERLRRTHATP